MLFFISAVIALPFWLWLANRTEKRTAYFAAVTMSGVCFLSYILLAGTGSFTLFLIASSLHRSTSSTATQPSSSSGGGGGAGGGGGGGGGGSW